MAAAVAAGGGTTLVTVQSGRSRGASIGRHTDGVSTRPPDITVAARGPAQTRVNELLTRLRLKVEPNAGRRSFTASSPVLGASRGADLVLFLVGWTSDLRQAVTA